MTTDPDKIMGADTPARSEARSPDRPAPSGAWRPIETAPQDGTPIIATGLDFGVGPGRHVELAIWWEGEWLNQRDPDNALTYLTHWQPLPPPPVDDGASPAPLRPPSDTQSEPLTPCFPSPAPAMEGKDG